jgi:hypothetical protein
LEGKKGHKHVDNMHHHLPAEGNFCDEHGNTLKPATVQDYNRHMGYMDKTDCMINTLPAHGP